MNENFNNVTIEGNLAKDAEIKEINGSKLVKFRICSSARNEKTIYIDCEWWDPTRASEFLTKGKKVLVVGTLIPEEWTDKSGNKVSKFIIRVFNLALRSSGVAKESADLEVRSEDLLEELSSSTKSPAECELPF